MEIIHPAFSNAIIQNNPTNGNSMNVNVYVIVNNHM